jgi:hypothetical protein
MMKARITGESLEIKVANGRVVSEQLDDVTKEVLKLNVSVEFTLGPDESVQMDEEQMFTDRLQACFERAIAEADIEARVLELMEA